MGYLALEVFDRIGTGSKYATLPADTVITITDTSEIFGSGDVWSYNFTMNIYANLHIFGSAGDLHGSRLHEQIDKRRARLWVAGLPLYLGYLRLDSSVEVPSNGDVEVKFESGQKTFDDMIEGTSAREVSVGDVEIGVALNRKRVVRYESDYEHTEYKIRIDGLEAYAAKYPDDLQYVDNCIFTYRPATGTQNNPFVQRWPKLVKSHGTVYKVRNGVVTAINLDYTNIQTPYDGTPSTAYCNINVCYPLKVNKNGDEINGRGYTMRLARGQATTDGGDNETRYNNAPNFYLLYWLDRLFQDMGIHIEENQAMNVEDLKRVFLLNYGCFYEEIEDVGDYYKSAEHTTPADKLERYGQYYMPLIRSFMGDGNLVANLSCASMLTPQDDVIGKVLLRDVEIKKVGTDKTIKLGSVEGKVLSFENERQPMLDLISGIEGQGGNYSAYLAYATGENYPDVDISDIINAMKTMFGVRFLFSDDYKRVRIVLLRNVFRNPEVQNIVCDIVDDDEKTETSIRGFRMTYGKGTDDTNFYYKGFNDLFQRASSTWRDTTDKHDYSQWDTNAKYEDIKQSVSSFNKKCYVTPVNGNAYAVKVDEDEDVLFPTLFEVGGYMDAEDGDCTGDEDTIEEVQAGASPVIMNDVNGVYASLFGGEMKAPTPFLTSTLDYNKEPENPAWGQKIATFGVMEADKEVTLEGHYIETYGVLPGSVSAFEISGKMDLFLSEGYQIRMEDNYSISNGGTPFDEADPGLQFGIMRGSGKDAYILYANDYIENENPLNDYWEVQPGAGAIDHPDTCDDYGELWDYDGSEVKKVDKKNSQEAKDTLDELFPVTTVRNAPLRSDSRGYITGAQILDLRCKDGKTHRVLYATMYSNWQRPLEMSNDWGLYQRYLAEGTSDEILQRDREGYGDYNYLIIEVDSTYERLNTVLALCELAFGSSGSDDSDDGTIYIDNGVGSLYGRFSLKLRAEKPNPFYDPDSSDSDEQGQYLEITNPNLRKRGLADQFYKEYSYLVRNGKTVKRPVKMELAQLLSIDKTVKAEVGDVTGFIKQMQFTVSNETGLGTVFMEMLYI